MSEQNNSVQETPNLRFNSALDISSNGGDSDLQQDTEASSISPFLNNARYRALIVDDNVPFQKLLALSLSMHPQIGAIDYADSGESAIEKVKVQQYDLIFMDAMMPGIDGYETCTRLRENPGYKYTPIIMVSGLTLPYDEAKAMIAGSTTFVTKPVQQVPFKELLTRVLTLLDYQKIRII